MRDRALHDVEGREAELRRRALRLLRDAFPDYRIVYAAGRWAAVDEGDPPEVWFAETPSSLCGQLFLAQLHKGGTIPPIRANSAPA
ncbi:hypothetical protein GCM10010106_23470 [Thermopolyspora flexuosa]|jgi:hypothetical protein|uniref:Uncharacterized protein n=1 Tax=Thermopolyspora flexuosa TaxID=103836 RepID=A0A543IV60_9ACTN|nr:hypothetical protein [Thermopolyspora flexuosa]TQM74465.1 hypothetical protein FHX40_1141 [Thermopolyspora flexuosa]GGM76285.1 hypothetical protein GCM10010106_23470 [Thermopolyspora flexuosa]